MDKSFEVEAQQSQGDKYLELLGLSDRADETVVVQGETIAVRDFMDICGEQAGPILDEIAELDPADPARMLKINTYSAVITSMINSGQGK